MESTENNTRRSFWRIKWLRLLFQLTILIAVAVTGYRFAVGKTLTSIEAFCPFGGLEAVISLITNKQFTCATGERNLALFLALLVLTILARKSFCSWICPVGTVSEWIYRFQNRLIRKNRKMKRILKKIQPSRETDQRLRWLRVPMLAAILFFTYKTGELIFRGFDPFYIMFSFHGHDVKAWSYLILAGFLIGIIIFPMAWCRYLCPLGIALWPFSAVGRIRLTRNESSCDSCRKCEKQCPHSIPITETVQVRSGECTLCLECVDACPHQKTLELHVEGVTR